MAKRTDFMFAVALALGWAVIAIVVAVIQFSDSDSPVLCIASTSPDCLRGSIKGE